MENTEPLSQREIPAGRTIKRPLHRTLLIDSVIFVLALCVMLSGLSYLTFSAALYTSYNSKLDNILTYVENNADADDLRQCVETGVSSEKRGALQQFLNGMVDDFGLEYLYIVIPTETDMVNVVSATSAAEFAAGETDMELLEHSDAYPEEELKRFRSFWEAEGIQYFEEASEYGAYYTACKPMRDSRGETVALICADLSIDALHRNLRRNVLSNIAMVVAICVTYGAIMWVWLRRNVTTPLRALEKSARDFASRSHGLKDFDQLRYEAPEIHTENEVQSLSSAIDRMAQDMRQFVEEILSAQERAILAEKAAKNLTYLAFQDPLTHVKSKAAYNQKVTELKRQIEQGDAQFGIVMVDLNNLKIINDSFGHEKGDQYIIGACMMVCHIYDHSPVYRVGGDEFVVVLQGRDYDNRAELYEVLSASFKKTREAADQDAWKHYSAAGGMAEFTPGDTYEQVFERADEMMYRDKQAMKAAASASGNKFV